MERNKRRRRKKDETISESWLLPYADMLTLLLALFIVLFAMSSLDAQKFRNLAQSLSSVFTSGTGIMEYPSPEEIMVPEEVVTDPSNSASFLELQDLIELQQKIDDYIVNNNLSSRLTTHLSGEGLRITILDNALFDSGSAEIKSDARQLGEEIANFIVSDPPRHVTISGHTDDVPIHNADYSSNWHLSVMRAINFMEVLLENDNLEPDFLSAKGYGEYRPIAENDSDENRAKNRRVEVLISPNYDLDLNEVGESTEMEETVETDKTTEGNETED